MWIPEAVACIQTHIPVASASSPPVLGFEAFESSNILGSGIGRLPLTPAVKSFTALATLSVLTLPASRIQL